MAEGFSVADLIGDLQKKYKTEQIAGVGMKHENVERVPSGMLAFDIASGGGFPKGRQSMVYGTESSGKTNLCYSTIANHQRMWPDTICSFIDIEHAFQDEWATKMGVDVTKLAIIKPEYSEQVVDIVQQLILATDCGLIITDSLAAMLTIQETEKSAEGANPGQTGLAITKLMKKTTQALALAWKEGRYPTIVHVNQRRFKIGVMFGDPESIPGGEALRFHMGLTVRLYGKNIVDKDVNANLACRKQVKGIIKKWKVPIYAQGFEYDVAMLPHNGLAVGKSDDRKLIKNYMSEFGLLSRLEGGGYTLMGEEFTTQKAAMESVMDDPNIKDLVVEAILGKLAAQLEGE